MSYWELSIFLLGLLLILLGYIYVWYQKLNGEKMSGIYIQSFGFFMALLCTLIFFITKSTYFPKIAILGFIISFLGWIIHTKINKNLDSLDK